MNNVRDCREDPCCKVANARRLSSQERLRRSREFRQIYTRGRRLTGPHLTIFFMPNHLPFNRLGISVTKKSFKLSTTRHSIQRRLREVYRLNKMRFLTGYDLVISMRRVARTQGAGSGGSKGRVFAVIKEELLALARQARLLKVEPGRS